jgi:DNA-binding protein HU-beta
LLLDNVIRPYGLQTMNKSQLIDALAARLGDRRTAASAVDGLLSTIVETVKAGESVSLTGFGVFEARARAARVGRNPRTGQTVAVPAATVPAFRPGTGFKTAVGGDASAPPAAARTRVAAAAVEAPAKPAAKASKAAKPAKEAKAAKEAKEAKAPAAKAGAAKTAAAKTAAPKTATAKASAKEAKAPAAKKGKKDTKADAKAASARKKAKK